MNPENEDAPAYGRGARKDFPVNRQARPEPVDKPKDQDYETRRNASACFRNEKKTEPWHADFTGVMVVEGLRNGDKCWVRAGCRRARNGDDYISDTVKPQQG